MWIAKGRMLDKINKCKGPEASVSPAAVENRLYAAVAGVGLGNYCSNQGERKITTDWTRVRAKG